MFLLSLIVICFLSAKPIQAQIPLFYQLIDAYQPSSDVYNPPQFVTPTPIPISTPPPPPRSLGKTITIAVLGDSMIDTLLPGLPRLKTALDQYFPGRVFRILNYGVGSRDIEYGLYRLTNDYDYRGKHIPGLVSQNPDIVVVESFAYNNFGNTPTNFDRYLNDLGAIITTITSNLPDTKIVIAATIAPNSAIFSNGIPNVHFTTPEKIEKTSTIKFYLQSAVDFAISRNLPLADAYHLSLFGNQGLKGFINPNDHLHLSDTGGQFFCDTLADTIYKNHLIN